MPVGLINTIRDFVFTIREAQLRLAIRMCERDLSLARVELAQLIGALDDLNAKAAIFRAVVTEPPPVPQSLLKGKP